MGHRNVIQLRETCHSEAVTDVTAVGIRILNVREKGLPRQSADWLAMTKPLTEWHCRLSRRFCLKERHKIPLGASPENLPDWQIG